LTQKFDYKFVLDLKLDLNIHNFSELHKNFT